MLMLELSPRINARWRGAARSAHGVVLGLWLIACHGDTRAPAYHDAQLDAASRVETPEAEPSLTARPDFCAHREHPTELDERFCRDDGAPIANIGSLRDLQRLLELEPFARTKRDDAPSHTNAVVLLGLSTALAGRLVSPLNPRAFILGRSTSLAYVRGAQEVELVSSTRDDPPALVFYLLRYRQACNHSDAGCSPADLYTPATESGWTDVTLQDDRELENTPFDCRACHARGATGETGAKLLMREVDGPWTHFFDSQMPERAGSRPEVTGYDLLQDYLAAKGDERYAEIDVSRLEPSTAQALEIAVGLDQPLYFDALGIERERWPLHDGRYDAQPQRSPIWEAAYDAFKRGEQLPLPHFDPRPTAPDKQAQLTAAYARYRNRELDARDLPDLADIFPDDPETRAQLGLAVEPAATPTEALIQACGPCHNNVLNQALSRARFNIDLARMPSAELEAAAARIELPPSAAGAMPPAQARSLSPETRAKLASYLRSQTQAQTHAPELSRAAASGMLGGSRARR